MQKLWQKYQRDERGTVVVFLAVAVFTLIIAVGIAVDMSRAQLVRSRLISAIDAATLSAGAVSSSQTDKIEEIVYNYFNANMPSNYMGVEVPSLIITVTDSNGATLDVSTLAPGDDAATIRVQADGTVETTFMRLAGIDTVPISTEAEVTRFSTSGPTLEIALVLDNSCSMGVSGTANATECDVNTARLDALKTATHTLLDTLYAGRENPSNLRVALIPFNQHVNQDASTSAPPSSVQSQGGGLVTSPNHDMPDQGIYYGDPNNAFYYDQCVNQKISSACPQLVYYCYNPNNPNVQPGSFNGSVLCPTSYPVFGNAVCNAVSTTGNFYDCYPDEPRTALQSITSFGESLTTLHDRVDAMSASGTTNTALGTLYALWALDPAQTGYFNHSTTPAADGDGSVIKNIVILTDGINEVCSTFGMPNSMEANCANTLALRNQQQIDRCAEANNRGINVFTITFALDDSTPDNVAQKNIFRNCASQPGYYFDADDGSALAAAFLAITDTLTQQSLRLTR